MLISTVKSRYRAPSVCGCLSSRTGHRVAVGVPVRLFIQGSPFTPTAHATALPLALYRLQDRTADTAVGAGSLVVSYTIGDH